MQLEHLKLDVNDFVATVTLNRPPVNAFGRAIRQEMITVFDALHDRKDVRAIVLTATGKIFCAGADIKERTLDRRAGEAGGSPARPKVFYSVMECSKPASSR
jgi:enoyl-CoA hydratase